MSIIKLIFNAASSVTVLALNLAVGLFTLSFYCTYLWWLPVVSALCVVWGWYSVRRWINKDRARQRLLAAYRPKTIQPLPRPVAGPDGVIEWMDARPVVGPDDVLRWEFLMQRVRAARLVAAMRAMPDKTTKALLLAILLCLWTIHNDLSALDDMQSNLSDISDYAESISQGTCSNDTVCK